MSEDRRVRVVDLPRSLGSDGTAASAPACSTDGNFGPPCGTDDLAQFTRSKVVEVLRRVAGNKTRAAQALGIERRKLYRLIEKYNIQDSPTS
jgi:transcriptional regulator of acetoin/glycerol metabolism